MRIRYQFTIRQRYEKTRYGVPKKRAIFSFSAAGRPARRTISRHRESECPGICISLRQTPKNSGYGIFQGIQGICAQGQCHGHGRRRNHRRGVRQNRLVARERHPHAADRRADRQCRLLEPAYRPLARARRHIGSARFGGRAGPRRPNQSTGTTAPSSSSAWISPSWRSASF